MLELELKARVESPDQVRDALRAAGATLAFAGRLHDRRYDRGGELAQGDHVLRTRRVMPRVGAPTEVVAWKGPTHRSEGYKARVEHEAALAEGESMAPILESLGYTVVQVIDRQVEVWTHAGGEARLEWYPEMDVLLEVEGDAGAIEAVIAATSIPRSMFSTDPLPRFAEAYHERTGRPAVLALRGPPPRAWEE